MKCKAVISVYTCVSMKPTISDTSSVFGSGTSDVAHALPPPGSLP